MFYCPKNGWLDSGDPVLLKSWVYAGLSCKKGKASSSFSLFWWNHPFFAPASHLNKVAISWFPQIDSFVLVMKEKPNHKNFIFNQAHIKSQAQAKHWTLFFSALASLPCNSVQENVRESIQITSLANHNLLVIKSTTEKSCFGVSHKVVLFHTMSFVRTVSMDTTGDPNLLTGWNNCKAAKNRL